MCVAAAVVFVVAGERLRGLASMKVRAVVVTLRRRLGVQGGQLPDPS